MNMKHLCARVRVSIVLLALVSQLGACAYLPILQRREQPELPHTGGGGSLHNGGSDADTEPDPEEFRRRVRESVPASPNIARPTAATSLAVWRRALNARALRIVVSTEHRALWLLRDSTIIMSAPVAVGMHEGFAYRGKRYDFRTPVGQRKVLAKATDPIWTPPEWHYFEKVVERNLEPIELKPGSKVELADGSTIEVRGDQVGRVNHFGNFAPFTPGLEIIFDGKIFIPPFGTAQRRIPEILGSHKLEMGDGYLIHGTPEEFSIGEAVSHGCVRMYNEDVEKLYAMAPIGTPIYIY